MRYPIAWDCTTDEIREKEYTEELHRLRVAIEEARSVAALDGHDGWVEFFDRALGRQ